MLDAVNTVLTRCNLPPVSTVDPPPSPAVSTIVQLIEQTNRDKQAKGWWFNLDHEVTLTPGLDGHIDLSASDIVQVETRTTTKFYAIRGGLLYELEAQSDEFSEPVVVDVQRLIPFGDTPTTWQTYLANHVAWLYSQQFRGNSGSTQTLQSEAWNSWVRVLQEDSRSLKRTVYDSPYTARTMKTYRNLGWG